MPSAARARYSALNWVIDAAVYGALAWWLWPRDASPGAVNADGV
jgi:hypothetical protein